MWGRVRKGRASVRCQDCVRVLGLFRSQRHLRVRSHRHASLAQGRAVDQHLALRAAGGEESAEGCRAAAHVHLQYPALQQRAAVLRVQLHGQRVQTQLARPLGRWSQHGWRRSNKHQSLALNPVLVGTCCASQSAAQPGGTRQQPRAGAGTGSCKRSRASSAAQQSHHALHVRKGTVHGPLRYLRRGLPGQLRAGEGEGVRADALRSASRSTHYAAELRMCTPVSAPQAGISMHVLHHRVRREARVCQTKPDVQTTSERDESNGVEAGLGFYRRQALQAARGQRRHRSSCSASWACCVSTAMRLLMLRRMCTFGSSVEPPKKA